MYAGLEHISHSSLITSQWTRSSRPHSTWGGREGGSWEGGMREEAGREEGGREEGGGREE